MTETEWLTSTDPAKMLAWRIDLGRQSLAGVPTYVRPSDRKLRLFACACCRTTWNKFTLSDQKAYEAMEQYADSGNVKDVVRMWGNPMPDAARYAYNITQHLSTTPEFSVRDSVQADLLRHIFGNPFRPAWSSPCDIVRWVKKQLHPQDCKCHGNGWVPIEPCRACLPQTVVTLAQALYDGSDCASILHDALMEQAERTDNSATALQATLFDMAAHFREANHPKGCWVIDQILNRS